jgi:hypothetical protein
LKERKIEEDGWHFGGKEMNLSQRCLLSQKPLELGQTTQQTMSGSFAPSKTCVLILHYTTLVSLAFSVIFVGP